MKYLLLAVLLFTQLGFAQQEKTFTHTIAKGETLYQIAKKYNVSAEDIVKLNPGVEKGIQENTVLQIPNNNSVSYLLKRNDVAAIAYTKHQVTAKETLFSIAREYNVSVKDLDELNADLLKDGLKIGQEILLPNKKKTIDGSARVINAETIFHMVQSKETKYSISKKYGITIEQLEMQNPEIINGLKEGNKLAINKSSLKAKTENEELMIALAEKQAEIEKAKAQKTRIEDLEDRLKVQKDLNKKMITLNKLNINLNAIDESKTGSVEKLRLIVDANKKIQDVLVWKLDSLASTMEVELADLKNRDVETLEESKKLEKESYKNIGETNALIMQLKQDLAKNRKIFTGAMQKVQRLTVQENQEYKKKVRENLSNRDIASIDEINRINTKVLAEDQKNEALLTKIDKIDTEKKEVLKRKISRATFYSAEAREFDDKLALVKLERIQNTIGDSDSEGKAVEPAEMKKTLSENIIKEPTKIEVISNLKEVEDGFYLVANVFGDAAPRDEFAVKLSYAGEKKTKFFYNVNNFGYYVYTDVFKTLNEALFEYKVKPSTELFKNLFIIQIKNEQ
ncbi:MAG: LysM peptidoglycan-binding domain-containing protein [Bacteroidota bacterium]